MSKRVSAEEIRAACDKFLESRGEKKMTFRDSVNKWVESGRKKQVVPRNTQRLEKFAQEVERDSQE